MAEADTASQKQETVWRQLGESEGVRQMQQAFTVATGLPLVVLPLGSTSCASAGCGLGKDAFCIQGCMGGHSGDLCLQTLRAAEGRAGSSHKAVRFRCPAGLLKVIVPVTIGGRHAGNLLAGPFALSAADDRKLCRVVQRLKDLHLEAQMKQLKRTWDGTPVVSAEKVQAVIVLAGVLASYLSESGNRLMLDNASRPSPLLQRIDQVLSRTGGARISLKHVAEQVRVSPCHFCKMFKKQTGLTFSEYRTRKRVEEARNLLLDPHRRIAEVAFQAGFGSLPYFNRAFRRYVGCSPSDYRSQRLDNPG